jgi:hypothetical protein
MELLLKYGFGFDMPLQKDGSVQLLDTNLFGMLSGCGNCLLGWVLNRKVMDGFKDAQITVRVATSYTVVLIIVFGALLTFDPRVLLLFMSYNFTLLIYT